jgi:hypothetical protein
MKKLLLALTLTVFALAPLIHADEASEQDPSGKWHGEKPNVLWIMIEDWSADLSCYGTPGVHTPNIDKLASDGIRFKRAYTTSPVCPTASSRSRTCSRRPVTTRR